MRKTSSSAILPIGRHNITGSLPHPGPPIPTLWIVVEHNAFNIYTHSGHHLPLFWTVPSGTDGTTPKPFWTSVPHFSLSAFRYIGVALSITHFQISRFPTFHFPLSSFRVLELKNFRNYSAFVLTYIVNLSTETVRISSNSAINCIFETHCFGAKTGEKRTTPNRR